MRLLNSKTDAINCYESANKNEVKKLQLSVMRNKTNRNKAIVFYKNLYNDSLYKKVLLIIVFHPNLLRFFQKENYCIYQVKFFRKIIIKSYASTPYFLLIDFF